MAKRKAAKAPGRTKKAAKRKGASRPQARRSAKRTGARKASASKGRARKSSKTPARKAPKGSGRAVARKGGASKALVRRRAAPKKAVARKTVARKTPALNRARRTVTEEDLLPSPPSSLDMDRSASAARSGRRELRERIHEHNETGPAMTGGDVDADWEGAYSVGDEAPGGDNPTPDQDVVDDIGKAIGVQYEDNEELKGEKKISDRDRKRWELDPASAEDYGHHEED
jgi:hypothetical protein